MSQENILDMPNQPGAVQAPASLPDAGARPKDYMLDWKTQKVNLGGGRSVEMRRRTAQEVLDRDAEMQSEIPLGKDGGFALPDPTLNEELDAKYFDLVKETVAGYPDEKVPEQHKAKAFNAPYDREIYVDEDFDLNDETVPVLEEIGTGDEPDFTVLHSMRPPTESELKAYRRKSANGEIKPGKRGRQIFKTRSNLRTAMSFYEQWLLDIAGATVDGKTWSDEDRIVFIAHVDPEIQRQVVNAVVEAYTVKLSD